MRKLRVGFIELICWIQIFLSPSVIIGFIGFACYKNVAGNSGVLLFVVLLAAGIGIGIYFAEKTRRTVGCSTLMFRMFASPDLNNLKQSEDEDSKKEGTKK